jgi:hypothetical protein
MLAVGKGACMTSKVVVNALQQAWPFYEDDMPWHGALLGVCTKKANSTTAALTGHHCKHCYTESRLELKGRSHIHIAGEELNFCVATLMGRPS